MTDATPDKSGQFFLHEQRGSRKLLVVFSAASAKSFTGYKLVQPLDMDLLFVRDPARSWYHGDTEGHWNGAAEMAEKVGGVARKYDRENVYLFGSSMGGYAALIVSHLLDIPNPNVHYHLGLLAMKKHNYVDAERWFSSAAILGAVQNTLPKHHATALLEQGLELIRQGRWSDARARFEGAAAIAPDDPRCQWRFG